MTTPCINGCAAEGMWTLPAVRNLHFTMAKPWDLKSPCHRGFERLNTLWWAAYAEPNTTKCMTYAQGKSFYRNFIGPLCFDKLPPGL